MKKVILVLVFAAIMLVGMSACRRDRIYVFNWGEFIYPPVLDMFEEEYGIRVIYTNYSSNEEMYESLASGGQFDVLFPSEYMIERLINEGRLARINFNNVPNARYIDNRFRNLPHDPQDAYSVPYKWGTMGLLYNVTMVDGPIDSWGILFEQDPRLDNNIFMYLSSRCTMAVALHYLGLSANTTNIADIHAARDLLISQGSMVRAFLTDQVILAMPGNEAALANVYSGDALWMMDENPNLRFVNPREGVQLFVNSMVIPSNARSQENAEKFINFMARPEIAYLNTMWIRYSTTNAGAFAMLPDDWQNCHIYWPDDETIALGEVFTDLGEFRSEVERAWAEVLISHTR